MYNPERIVFERGLVSGSMNLIEPLKAEALEITRDELKIADAKSSKTKSGRIYGRFLRFPVTSY